jgi:hypothetical protein
VAGRAAARKVRAHYGGGVKVGKAATPFARPHLPRLNPAAKTRELRTFPYVANLTHRDENTRRNREPGIASLHARLRNRLPFVCERLSKEMTRTPEAAAYE